MVELTQDRASARAGQAWARGRGAVAWALGLGVLCSGCTKLNAAFEDTATEGGAGQDSTSDGKDATSDPGNTTSQNDSNSGTTSVGGSGMSTGNGGDSGSGGPRGGSSSGSTGERESETGRPLSPWNSACEFNPVANLCPALAEVDPHLLCILSFEINGRAECGADVFGTLQLVLDAGAYVFGSLQLPLAQFRAFEEEEEVLACSPGPSVFETDETLTVDFEVWNELGNAALFYIRSVDDLCVVPDECCDPGGGVATDACDLEGLRACVLSEAPDCAISWGPACVRVAMLRCGADCT